MGLCFLAHGFLHLESLRSLRTHRVRSDHLVCPALLELAEFAAWRIYALVKQGRETPDFVGGQKYCPIVPEKVVGDYAI